MIKSLHNNVSFISNQKSKKISNNFNLNKTFTPVKLIPKAKSNFNENNLSTNMTKGKKLNKLYIKTNKNNNIKLKLLNPTKKNSRNFSLLNGFSPYHIIEKSDYKSFNTNNSLSITTNLKTTMDSNITKTQYNKDKKINKENSSFIDNKTSIIINSSYGCKNNINPQIKNLSNIKKRPKVKIPRSKSNIFIKNKNLNINNTNKIINVTNNYKILNCTNLKKNSKKINENEKVINNNNNNNSFVIPKRINILKNIYNNYLTPIRHNTKIKYRNSLSLNKKINKMEKNISLINKEQKTIDNNKISIKRTKLKNIYMLLEKQKESITNKDKIKKEKEEIDLIVNKLKNIKDKTNIINNEVNKLNKEYFKNKRHLNEMKESINNILNDKKNVNTMIILLHRRIIDIKKRIKDHDEKNHYLDKSFYELGVKYQQDGNNINKSSFEK